MGNVVLTTFNKAQKFKCPSCGTVLPEPVVRAGRCTRCDARLSVPGAPPQLYRKEETALEEIHRRASLRPYAPPAASSADVDRVIREDPSLWRRYREELADASTDSAEFASYDVKQARVRTPPAAALIEAAVSIIKSKVGCTALAAMDAYAKTASGRETYSRYLAEMRALGDNS